MVYSLYIHIPFCAHRCAYCDFNTYAGQEDALPAYVRALCREISFAGEAAGHQQKPGDGRIGTVFFGGGTPSLLSPAQFNLILSAIRQYLGLLPETEISFEANPGTVSRESLFRLREIGLNRISFGVQSANPEELRMLERQHSYFDVISAVQWAREAGFENLNLDLIYGLPEQKPETWQATVRRAVQLNPEHLSLYALTLEHGTPFGRWAARGLLPLPDPDLAAEMYEWASDFLAGAGYLQYEISNWAKPGDSDPGRIHERRSLASSPPHFACRHNLQYWRSLPYLGLGAGAHGYVNGLRYSNVLRIKTYIDRLDGGAGSLGSRPWPLTPAAVNHHRNSRQEDMSEYMITGLRLTSEGVAPKDFAARFGVDLHEIYGKEIQRLVELGLLEWVLSPRSAGTGGRARGDRLRLTYRARLIANQVFVEFV
jgi:oxygen-independent coproporphyrinogen-3 oxidase